jgi:hypothetical protein
MNAKSAYDALLHEICVGLGFCGSVVNGQPLHVDQLIPEHGAVTADQFVEWVFRAEGMDSDKEGMLKHAASLRDAFVRHMGSEAVDARLLK